jgi:hypothetical protein
LDIQQQADKIIWETAEVTDNEANIFGSNLGFLLGAFQIASNRLGRQTERTGWPKIKNA